MNFHKKTKRSDEITPAEREKIGTRAGAVGILANLLLSSLKFIFGLLSSSVSIMADAFNNLSDAGSSVMAIISFKISAKPADRDHPFGHARVEYLCSLVVSFLILLVGTELLISSAGKIFAPSDSDAPSFSYVTIAVLSASILIKLALGLIYTRIGRTIDSSVLSASGADALMDMLSTSGVLIGALIVKFTSLVIVDAIVGLLVSGFIIYTGIKILLETKNSILGEAPVDETVTAIQDIVNSYPEALGIHDLMVHNYGPRNLVASLHVEVDGDGDIYKLHDVIDNIERKINTELGIFCTIHMDPIVTNDEVVNELRDFVVHTVAKLDEKITVHDFRTVVGETHTNLIFDIVLPYESAESAASATEKISSLISNARPECYCVITVDRG